MEQHMRCILAKNDHALVAYTTQSDCQNCSSDGNVSDSNERDSY